MDRYNDGNAVAGPSHSPHRTMPRNSSPGGRLGDGYQEEEGYIQEELPRGLLLVRAKFDLNASDPSALSFRQGDIIDVVSTLDSGWWDGILGGKRGWFPSNFVDIVEGEEGDKGEYEDREQYQDQVQGRGAGNRRTVLAEDVLGMEDALGAPWGGGDDDLEALARSMGVGMDLGAEPPGEGEDEFMMAARRQRARADNIATTSPVSPTINTGQSLRDAVGLSPSDPSFRRRDEVDEGGSGADEEDFGAGLLQGAATHRRERENTAGTIRGEPGVIGGHTTPMPRQRLQDTPRAEGRGAGDSSGSSVRSEQGGGSGSGGVEDDDGWIPCLTPDGQVYYHNTLTGEDSWDLPVPQPDEDDTYDDEETDYFPTPSSARPTSSDNFHSSDHGGGFRVPPKATTEIPYPWISRLSDDGARYYYVNRLTGVESLDLPREDMIRREGDSLGHMDEEDRSRAVPPPNSSSTRSAVGSGSAKRPDTGEARAKALSDWERRSRHKIEIALRPAEKSSLGIMLEIINDTLREVFEATVAGSAAEEEMSRASDLNSSTGRVAAIAREEAAIDMLNTTHRNLLAAITDLLRAFGYVGPIDRLEDMARPAWTGDMTLIGSIGVFSANVHAALRSKRVPESGLSVWQEVMRSGSKLRDVLTDFPEIATGGKVVGRPLWSWIGMDEPIGAIYGGRWGFGTTGGQKILDGSTVAEAEHIRADFEAASAELGQEGAEVELMRIADRFKASIHSVDLAGCLDVDGPADSPENDSLMKYGELVDQARSGLGDLDKAVLDIDRFAYSFYFALTTSDSDNPSDEVIRALHSLNAAITTSSRSLSNLLIVSGEQRGIVRSTAVKGRIGLRSPNYTAAPIAVESTPRPLSIISDVSRGSRTSRSSGLAEKRGKVRGLEDDFQDEEERLDRSVAGGSQEASSDIGISRRLPPVNTQQLQQGPSHQAQQRAKRDSMSGSGGLTRATPSPISASGSQSSLARIATGASGSGTGGGGGHKHQISAGSSTTSLAYQRTESDAGSTRGGGGQRASTLMKGFFGRSKPDPEAELREKVEKAEKAEKARIKEKGNRKLAKLLGEDVSHVPRSSPTPPPPAPLQQPLQRQQSLSQSIETRTPPSASFASIPPPPPLIETPWYLSEDYQPEEIVFDDKGGVKAGTLRALVARLTPHGATDTSFFQAFMLTFRSFTSGDLLFDLLLERFNIPMPAGLDAVQQADWTKLKQTPIRLRVTNVFRAWLDVHYMIDQDEPMLDRIEKFTNEHLVNAFGSEMLRMLSKTLLNVIARRRRNEDSSQRRVTSGGLMSPPAPLLPRVSGKQLQLTDISPLELARQLTIIEFNNFQKIRPAECLHKVWTDEDEGRAKNVRLVIHTANKLAAWIGLLVLSPKDPKSRATLMKYFIQCAMELRNMNNFSSMAGIIAGLNAAPIDRLKRSKEHLSTKSMQMKEDLDRTMDSSKNFANYKEMLKTINPPCVPFLGFYLSALTFIEDGNKDMITPATAQAIANRGMSTSASSTSLASTQSHPGPGTTRSPIQPLTASTSGTPHSAMTASTSTTTIDPNAPPREPLINFFKRGLSAEILRDIQQYQSQPYNLAKCRPVYDFLMNGLEKVETGGAGNDLYDRSLALEPREREEERIQRMLHDSVSRRDLGFPGGFFS